MKPSVLKSHFFLCLVGATLLASGCANISTLQTARVEKPDGAKFVLGGGYVQQPDLNNTLNTGLTAGYPYAEAMYRHGIVQNLDIGLKATVPGTLGLDGKYQLLDISNFVLSVGLGGGWTSQPSLNNAGSVGTSTIIDLSVPVYASYDFTDWFALYVSPKFVSRIVSGSNNTAVNGFNPMIGGSAGFKLGSRWGFMGEASYGIPFNKAIGNQLQFDGGFFWGYGSSAGSSS